MIFINDEEKLGENMENFRVGRIQRSMMNKIDNIVNSVERLKDINFTIRKLLAISTLNLTKLEYLNLALI